MEKTKANEKLKKTLEIYTNAVRLTILTIRLMKAVTRILEQDEERRRKEGGEK